MVKIIGNDILRSGQKIGWINGNDIMDGGGRKIGWFTSNDIFDREGHKIGYVIDSFICRANSSAKIAVSENNKHITGGGYSDICRAAIRLLIGD